MQITKQQPSETEAILIITPSEAELRALKDHVLEHFKTEVKIPGFREGKAPLPIIEKQVDPTRLQNRFLEEAIGQMYEQAITQEQLRVVGQPDITLKKFVPFTMLEFEAKVPIIATIKLPDYKKISFTGTKVTIGEKEIKEVLGSLQKQLADKKTVGRAAQDGDEAWIDFKGVDAKGQPIKGADGQNYPLTLGSNAFIPGFEANVIGMKPGEEKTFTLTFPKDYNVTALANKKVTFTVTLTKLQELQPLPLDDAFAQKAGPFQTLSELKADIKKQLTHERQHEADRNDESELIHRIIDKSKINAPQVLVDDAIDRLIQNTKQNLIYRGQTYQEFLESQGLTEEQYRKELEPQAVEQVKGGLVLAEIAQQEKLEVTPEELEVRLLQLKSQYSDPQMQAELDKPENRRDIASRLLTEKTIARIKQQIAKSKNSS